MSFEDFFQDILRTRFFFYFRGNHPPFIRGFVRGSGSSRGPVLNLKSRSRTNDYILRKDLYLIPRSRAKEKCSLVLVLPRQNFGAASSTQQYCCTKQYKQIYLDRSWCFGSRMIRINPVLRIYSTAVAGSHTKQPQFSPVVAGSRPGRYRGGRIPHKQ